MSERTRRILFITLPKSTPTSPLISTPNSAEFCTSCSLVAHAISAYTTARSIQKVVRCRYFKLENWNTLYSVCKHDWEGGHCFDSCQKKNGNQYGCQESEEKLFEGAAVIG